MTIVILIYLSKKNEKINEYQINIITNDSKITTNQSFNYYKKCWDICLIFAIQ